MEGNSWIGRARKSCGNRIVVLKWTVVLYRSTMRAEMMMDEIEYKSNKKPKQKARPENRNKCPFSPHLLTPHDRLTGPKYIPRIIVRLEST